MRVQFLDDSTKDDRLGTDGRSLPGSTVDRGQQDGQTIHVVDEKDAGPVDLGEEEVEEIVKLQFIDQQPEISLEYSDARAEPVRLEVFQGRNENELFPEATANRAEAAHVKDLTSERTRLGELETGEHLDGKEEPARDASKRIHFTPATVRQKRLPAGRRLDPTDTSMYVEDDKGLDLREGTQQGKEELKRSTKGGESLLEVSTARLETCLAQDLGVLDLSNLGLGDTELAALFPQIVSEGGHVWALLLASNNLTRLPEDLGKLKHLTILNLRRNHLRSLPESIDKCQNLRELNAAENELESLPSGLFGCPVLSSLNLSQNQLTKLITDRSYDFKLRSLTALNLSQNKISKVPDALSQAPLTVLDLSQNLFQGLPETFEMLTTIRMFIIDNNPCIDRIPKALLSGNNAMAVLSHLAGRR
uniref:Uncharacterized protein n=1 Tax=Rhodosorus marinus TaxID=101924 RepID=A0A7S3A107_9RHOD|mmetsp:Transcript_36941/g.147379  ORF Transcript_36941/g.147379 Transcript_36941/m.147379 type:complete len:419 (+) Transcript_36941:149-1405(+)